MTLEFIIGWVLVIIFLNVVADFIWKRIFMGSGYRIFVAPGVIIHELAHAFACLLTRAKVKEISFFDSHGGFVRHEKPKLKIIGPVIISIAPLIVGFALIIILAKFILIGDGSIYHIKLFSFSEISRILGSIKLDSFRNLLIFYLISSIGVTMSPSAVDIKNAFWGSVVLVVIIWVINYFFTIKLPTEQIIAAFSIITMILILGIIFSIILAMAKSILIK